jgi:predicted Fe-Mo cluster-binding NifX family protein
MKAVFSTWNNRIAPVFDVSTNIVLVEVESGKILRKEKKNLPNALPVQTAQSLIEIKADLLFCGAISRSMHETICSYGISVIPFVAGDLGDVIEAWRSGITDWSCFAMPGCRFGGRRRNRGRGEGRHGRNH